MKSALNLHFLPKKLRKKLKLFEMFSCDDMSHCQTIEELGSLMTMVMICHTRVTMLAPRVISVTDVSAWTIR